jgi:hypothetical protein
LDGGWAQLPAPSARGTERDSFPSLGSSSTKGRVNESLTRELGMPPSEFRDTHPQPLYMSFDNAGVGPGAATRDAPEIRTPQCFTLDAHVGR